MCASTYDVVCARARTDPTGVGEGCYSTGMRDRKIFPSLVVFRRSCENLKCVRRAMSSCASALPRLSRQQQNHAERRRQLHTTVLQHGNYSLHEEQARHENNTLEENPRTSGLSPVLSPDHPHPRQRSSQSFLETPWLGGGKNLSPARRKPAAGRGPSLRPGERRWPLGILATAERGSVRLLPSVVDRNRFLGTNCSCCR